MTEALARLKAYVRDNGGTRLVLGLCVLAAILCIMIMSWVSDLTRGHEVSLVARKTELANMRDLAADDQLDERIDAYRAILEAYRGRVYSAATSGLMSADIQALVRRLAEEGGLTDVLVNVGVEEIGRAGLVRFTIDIGAIESVPGKFPTFLKALQTQEAAFYLSTLTWDAQGRRVALRLSCLGRLEAADNR
jgi:hypothetical protein